ncbi:hypothetical protein SCP_0607720 [Sparassis crispa]|uniref:Uncharacterized protein n=1 Tax=Sparassis crispa TaxID=139825 RepID=A0A401GRE1_9APHY|nr:hypothetical protein SCP_0607720 [Sparassis crispa]GBE84792.1 hypothetical protein SCP_0607720 [Sparassis crispa]
MLYYGVPVIQNHMHLLVPDDQLETAYKVLLAAGYKDSPLPLIPMVSSRDPNTHWEELGCPAYRMVLLRDGKRSLIILIQNYSAAASTFDDANPSSFEQCAGLAIPPLPLLGQSFLRTYFTYFKSSGRKSRVSSILQVWCASVKLSGYAPLGVDAMRGVPGISDAMTLYWERGY